MVEEQSEWAKKLNDAVRAVDKLARHLRENTAEVLKRIEELKGLMSHEEKDDH